MALQFNRFMISVLGLFFACAIPSSAQRGAVDRKIDSLLSLMTLEEKCGQLNQISAQWKGGVSYITDEEKEMIRQGFLGSLLNLAGASSVREVQRIAVEESRLRIPLILGLDVIHGYRTVFPVPLAEACTWDPELVERASRVAAIEASAAGLHWTFAPMVDIARDPRWGRIVEGSGEDPYLGSEMAAARVRGFQGKNLHDPTSILACAKHYAAYGAAEAGRDYNTVDISERTLREIYLPPFKGAVDAGVGSFMTAFNEVAGSPSTSSKFLLTDVLRKEWGFNGFVVSDWTAIAELMNHGVAATRADAGMLAVNAGTDMDMVSKIYVKELPSLVRNGKVKKEILNEAVRRVLRAKFALGLFSDPYRGVTPEREKASMLTADHLKTALEAARKSIVLLKNEKTLLPLQKNLKTIAVIGPLADNKTDLLGPWHAQGRGEDVVSVLDGIKSRVSSTTKILYTKGSEFLSVSDGSIAEALRVAKQADVVIVVLGEKHDMSAEAASRADIGLPAPQLDLLKEVVATKKPTVLILMNGRPLTISWEADSVPAIVEAWWLGVQAGSAIADVLFGEFNPSGKLTVTFPRSVGQVPLYYNHKNTGRPFSAEDKFTSKYLDIPNTPLYPFGYGLSYTSFAYSNLKVHPPKIGMNDSVLVSVHVKNAGKREGDEVVQLYLQDVVASVTRPVKELKGFRRITLKPGETKSISFAIYPHQLSFLDLNLKPVVEPGTFKVFVGGNSVDVLEAEFELQPKRK